MDYISDFISAMQKAGYEIDRAPIADDRIHTVCANGERHPSFSYRLAIDADGAVGWFRCFKDGVLHKYNSRMDSGKMSPDEVAALRKRRADAKRRRDKELADAQAAAASVAKRVLAGLKPADGSDAYSKGKTILPTSAKWFTGGKVEGFDRPLPACLVVPIYNRKGICNVQFIERSFKLFLPQAELTGCYGVITSGPPSGRLWVAEGYATACTIHALTGQAVAVAFNAGNLKPVADFMAGKYPTCEVCIAADNDHEKEAAGKGNAGIRCAKESGYKYTSPPSDAGITDWNDYAAAHGDDAARDALLFGLDSRSAATAPHATQDNAPAVTSDDWMRELHYSDKGGLVKNSLNNVALYMRHHEKFKKLFWYDEFFRQVVVQYKGQVQPISDEFVMDMCLLAERNGLNKNYDFINKIIIMVAKERPINPAKNYFEKLKWDGERRLDNWLSYYMGAEDEPAEYLAFIGKKWLTAAVNRVFEAGCKFDHVLVIEGEQGLGKSTALKTLATFGDESRCYCTDAFSFSDIEDKDSIRKTNGNIIVELAEMVGHNKKETEEIKRWITMQEDVARFAYARHEQRFPRMFVLACTTNNYEYLNDPTANRRYWPFKAKAIDIEALKRDRTQLWAEAVHCYKSKLYLGPTPDEMDLAKVEQNKRLESDPWASDVEAALVDLKHRPFTTGEVMRAMSMQLRDKDHRAKRRIASILMNLGYSNKARWDSDLGKTVRDWRRE